MIRLTIGITVCDNDFENCSELLKQISERIKIPHEVIIIDNREKCKDSETEWQASYSFGYNAYQFSARAKIFELAKGEYIWFIDGDDEIGTVDHFDYEEDIIVFSYSTYPVGDVHISEQKPDKLFSYETSCLIRPVLWNKFIKRSLFSKAFIEKSNVKIVTNEDTLWCYEALRHAKSLKIVDEIIYHHKEGLSNKQRDIDIKDLQTLVTGFDVMQNLMREVIDDDYFYFRSIKDTINHVMSFVPKTKDMEKSLSFMEHIIPKEYFLESVRKLRLSPEQHKIVFQRYGEKAYNKITCKVTYADGSVKDYTFKQKIDFN